MKISPVSIFILVAVAGSVYSGIQPPVMVINPRALVLFTELETVDLPCKASGEPQPTYIWKKDKRDFNVAGSDDLISTVENEGTLVFKQPKKKDAGTYQCFANNSYGVAMSGIVELRLAFLQPYTNQEPETITVSPGSCLVLPCNKPISYPEAKFTWLLKYSDGRLKVLDFTERIQMDHKTNLVFANVQEEDSYKDTAYVCAATNLFLRRINMLNTIYLRTLPEQLKDYQIHILSASPSKMVFLKGDTVELQCIFGGHPTPKIRWYRNGKLIHPNTKYAFSKFDHQLDIRDAGFEDEGDYECHASERSSGQILQHTMRVEIESKPEWTTKPKSIVTSGGSSVTFICNGTGKPPISKPVWYINGKRINEYSNKNKFIVEETYLSIINVTRQDYMTIQCNISNIHGYIFAEAFLSFHEKIRMEHYPSDLEVSKGAEAIFTCATTSDTMQEDDLRTIWWKDGKAIAIDDRISQNSQNNSLTIRSVTRNDVGRYTCMVTDGLDSVNASAFLSVKGTQPPVMLINPPTQVLFKEFQTAVLPCKASGEPQPTYTWKKDKQDFNVAGRRDHILTAPNEGTLVFKRPKKKDAGTYQCFANNSYGVAMSGIVELRHAFLQPYIDQEPETITVLPGASLVLPCNMPFSYPEPNVTWVLKRDHWSTKALNFTERILMDRQGNLVFVNVQEEDSYKDTAYARVAFNMFVRIFSVGKSIYLKTLPGQPKDHQIQILSASPKEMVFLKGDTVKLECIFGGHPTPKIRWYRNGKSIHPNTKYAFSKFNHQLDIRDAGFEDEGDYECHASERSSGQILQHTMRVEIGSKPEWTTKPKSIVVSDGSSATFICNGTSKPPISKHLWYINGIDIHQYPNNNKFIVRKTNLTVINLTYQDSMTIQCNISNIHGYIFANVFLNVFAKPPDILEDKEKTQKHAEGQSINITCRTTGYDLVQVHWSKDNKEVTGGRFRTLSNGSLNIKNLVLADAGVYRCDVSNKYGMVSATRTLIVRRKTRFEHFPVDLVVYKGEDAKFTCVAMTDPMEADNLRIVWSKDDDVTVIDEKRIIQNPKDNSLIIRSVKETDAGLYSCVATNGLDFIKAFARLKVRAKIRIEPSPSNLVMKKGEDAQFMCGATTDSIEVNNPHIIWRKDTEVIDINEDINEVIQNSKTSLLIIRNVTRNDAGRYMCLAINGLDIVNASALLTVKDGGTQPPVMLINPPTQVPFKELEAVVVPCKASGEPQPTYTWKKDKRDFNVAGSDDFISTVPNEGTLVFERPKKKDAGTYQCFANNSYGVAMSGIVELRLAFLMPYTNQEPETITVLPGASLVLPCNKPISYPEANVTWVLKHKDGSFKAFDFTERILMDHQANLIFTNVLEEDSCRDAAYVCMATNKFNREATRGKPFHLKTIPMPPENHQPHLINVAPNKGLFLKGDTVKLQCIFGGHPTPEIRWFRNTKERRIQIEQDTKYRFSSSKHQLNILDAGFEDEGIYECHARVTSFSQAMQRVMTVKIESKPEWTKPKSIVTSVGSSVTFICNGTSKPPISKHMWYINGKRINEYPNKNKFIVQETNLTVINLTYQDSMTIQCNMSNIHGYIFADAFLYVFAEAPDLLEKGNMTLKRSEGQTINITCKTTGYDSVQVLWMKDNKQMTGDRYHILRNGNLNIKNLDLTDTGVYHCYASNKYGMVSATRNLIVRRKTKIEPSAFDRRVKEGRAVTLPCAATTDPMEVDNLQVIWLKDGKSIDMDEGRIIQNTQDNSLTINSVIIGKDGGRYTCVATNGLDWAKMSTFLYVMGP
ncbi:hemicentin-1-like isoform X2 [Octopus sinensis]|uniref:Hemicentin-1-like isoform X2 n=1 Tax=Octopus sinensis TaxID=2607531 RepID=A0A7E6FRC6_9MOLL|nr:hemicentin-1-like isoform X2 [Octopus sinensis]